MHYIALYSIIQYYILFTGWRLLPPTPCTNWSLIIFVSLGTLGLLWELLGAPLGPLGALAASLGNRGPWDSSGGPWGSLGGSSGGPMGSLGGPGRLPKQTMFFQSVSGGSWRALGVVLVLWGGPWVDPGKSKCCYFVDISDVLGKQGFSLIFCWFWDRCCFSK